jgi:hypothetical protein
MEVSMIFRRNKIDLLLFVFILFVNCSQIQKVETKYENGKLQERYYVKWNSDKTDKIKDGKYISWYPNGKIWREGNYKNGASDGLFVEWYTNGQKKVENNFKSDSLITAHEWNEDGSVKIDKTRYDHGTFKQLVMGKSKSEIVSLLGKPGDITDLQFSGGTLWEYQFFRSSFETFNREATEDDVGVRLTFENGIVSDVFYF